MYVAWVGRAIPVHAVTAPCGDSYNWHLFVDFFKRWTADPKTPIIITSVYTLMSIVLFLKSRLPAYNCTNRYGRLSYLRGRKPNAKIVIDSQALCCAYSYACQDLSTRIIQCRLSTTNHYGRTRRHITRRFVLVEVLRDLEHRMVPRLHSCAVLEYLAAARCTRMWH